MWFKVANTIWQGGGMNLVKTPQNLPSRFLCAKTNPCSFNDDCRHKTTWSICSTTTDDNKYTQLLKPLTVLLWWNLRRRYIEKQEFVTTYNRAFLTRLFALIILSLLHLSRTWNLATKLLCIKFLYNCACPVFGQWNVELEQIIPEVLVFPFRRTRVTWAFVLPWQL